jgi:hypothetical protein
MAVMMSLVGLVLLASCIMGDDKSYRKGKALVPDYSELSAEPTPTPTPEVIRPSGQVYIQSDFCSCLNSKPDIIGNCTSFCAERNDTNPTLYVNVELGTDITLNSIFSEDGTGEGNLAGWCRNEISDGRTNPGCKLQFYDGYSTNLLDIILLNGTNAFTADISSLSIGKTYVLKLIESNSGSKASSDSFQLRRTNPPSDIAITGPLRITGVSQYSCLVRSGEVDGAGYNYYNDAIEKYFYYPRANTPPTLPPGQNFTFCHDIIANGDNDSPLYPRLRNIDNYFSAWNETDLRFFDQDSNGILDANDQIKARLEDLGETISGDLNIFFELRWQNALVAETSSSGETTTVLPRLGFFMAPWTEETSQRGFCPTQVNYDGTNKIFNVLKEIVGVDTEALYLAQREPQTYLDKDGNSVTYQNIMFIRETVLDMIRFYTDSGTGQLVPADDITAQTETIMFFWPPNPQAPLVKQSYQKIYTIRTPEELSTTPETPGVPRTTVRPADKRFACIPSSGEPLWPLLIP